MKKKTIAIIQARMGSTRLPNKVLLPLGDCTVLEQVVRRVKKSKRIDEVIVATTTSVQDDEIVALCSEKEIICYRGSENDVLDRYYQCAKIFEPENVIRITADCPLMDAEVIDSVIQKHLENNNDYTSNTLVPTFPDGEDVEIMKFSILEDAWKNAVLASQREHVTQYIIHNEKYKKGNVAFSSNLEKMRWTLDTEADYKFISQIYDALYAQKPMFGVAEVLELLEQRPELMEINHDQERNEGLKKSLEEDYIVNRGSENNE